MSVYYSDDKLDVPRGAILVRSAEGRRAPYEGVSSQDALDELLEAATVNLRQIAEETA